MPALLVAGQRVGMMIDLIKRKFTKNNNVKGTVSRDGHFFEGLKISSRTFCECANGFQGTFHCP